MAKNVGPLWRQVLPLAYELALSVELERPVLRNPGSKRRTVYDFLCTTWGRATPEGFTALGNFPRFSELTDNFRFLHSERKLVKSRPQLSAPIGDPTSNGDYRDNDDQDGDGYVEPPQLATGNFFAALPTRLPYSHLSFVIH